MTQTRTHSALEQLVNTTIGAVISYMLTFFVLPYWGLYPSHADAFEITFAFTFASLVRGYFVRRLFNWRSA